MKYLTIAIYVFLAIGVVAGVASFFVGTNAPTPESDPVACPADAKQCPDGSFVSREGPNCEFAECPPLPAVPDDIADHIEAHEDLITVAKPVPNATVTSPLAVSGAARGTWFFEGDFPLILTDWDGRIIAESYATAEGAWMTENFVNYAGTLDFTSPCDPELPVSCQGTLIFQKANPSGLPENDDALEIPVRFPAAVE